MISLRIKRHFCWSVLNVDWLSPHSPSDVDLVRVSDVGLSFYLRMCLAADA